MLLIDAIRLFDDARRAEVSAATRAWFFLESDGRFGGKLGRLAADFPDAQLANITAADLRRWLAHLKHEHVRYQDHPGRPADICGLSQDGYRNYVRAVRQFFRWCKREGLITRNPSDILPVPPPARDEPKAISIEDATKITAVARWYALRDMAFFRLLEAGAKHGELDGLELEHVVAGGILVSRRNHDGRYLETEIPLSDQATSALQAYLRRRGQLADEGETAVFVGRRHPFRYCVRGGIALGVRNEAMLQVLAASAARAGAVASLRRDHLASDFSEAKVYTKGRAGFKIARRILLDQDAAAALRRWLDIAPPGPMVFPSNRGPLTGSGVYQILTGLAAAAEVDENTNPHAWRHAWSLEALRRGADVGTVARVLGNKPETVMANYARWADNDIRQRHKQFSWRTAAD